MSLPKNYRAPAGAMDRIDGATLVRDWRDADSFFAAQADEHWAAHRNGSDASRAEAWSDGTGSWDACYRWARYGWPEGAARMRPIAARIAESVGSQIPEQVMAHGVVGIAPDVGVFLSGAPESMVYFTDSEDRSASHERGRIIRVVVSVAYSHRVPASAIENRGAAVLALMDAIQQAGHLGECIAANGNAGNGVHSVAIRVPVKRSDEPLNIERAAFMLAHAGMLRRLCFADREQLPQPWANATATGGYGQSWDYPGDERGTDIYLPRLLSDWREWETPASAEAWVREQAAALGLIEGE